MKHHHSLYELPSQAMTRGILKPTSGRVKVSTTKYLPTQKVAPIQIERESRAKRRRENR